eukprot:COSAG05_NODE_4306_length_1572_cov_1.379498_2_plen_118_part_00
MKRAYRKGMKRAYKKGLQKGHGKGLQKGHEKGLRFVTLYGKVSQSEAFPEPLFERYWRRESGFTLLLCQSFGVQLRSGRSFLGAVVALRDLWWAKVCYVVVPCVLCFGGHVLHLYSL